MIRNNPLTRAWRAWRNDEDGSVAVETLLMVPLLSWAFLSTLVYFDAYRTEAISERAGLTIADMLSRETGLVNQEYLDGTVDLLEFLTLHDSSPELRVTVFYKHTHSNGNQHLHRAWSKVKNSTKDVLTTANIRAMESRLPDIGDEERAILVETWTDYDPPYEPVLASSLNAFEMGTFTVISPRFTDSLCWNNDPTEDPTKTIC